MADIAVEIFLQNLEQLISSDLDFIAHGEKEQLQCFHDELRFLGDFLRDSEGKRDKHPEVKELVMQIKDVTFKAENMVDSFVAEAFKKKGNRLAEKSDSFIMFGRVRAVKEEIKVITTKLKEIYEKYMFEIGVLKDDVEYSGGSSSGLSIPQLEVETVLGLDDKATRIIEQLDEGRRKLKIKSIGGAPGAGKTTLARKVYYDLRVKELFSIRGWVTVSQAYSKRGLLIGILESCFQLKDEDKSIDDDKLGEQLLKRLKGKKYLIVLDDIWDTRAWRDIERSFPNENNGSNIVFTTRLTQVAVDITQDQDRHDILPLSRDESWKLFQNKVFGKERCPTGLEILGNQIAEQCRGLPLAIVAIGGILANEEKTPQRWKQVANSLSSVIARNEEVVMGTLALSYDRLPVHLKACFLYFGAFPEDYEIPVRKLILLLIAERFIKQSGEKGKSLEALAEDYLTDLVGRNLVMVATKRPNGKIKSCRIHDVLRELCLRKAVEDNFLVFINQVSHLYSSSVPNSRRLGIVNHIIHESLTLHTPNVRSILSYELGLSYPHNFSCFPQGLTFLRVLDLLFIDSLRLPREIEHLILLRYLALNARFESIPPSISKLRNLETLIIRNPYSSVALPPDMLSMVKLRHLYIQKSGTWHFGNVESGDNCSPPYSLLENLQTMCYVCPCNDCLLFLAERAPNLRKLGFRGDRNAQGFYHEAFPNLECFQHLETLKYCFRNIDGRRNSLDEFKFPSTVKNITLSWTCVHWGELSILASLPYLEVLKLLSEACEGPEWDMVNDEGIFRNLVYLKFQGLNIENWYASDAHFPILQKLVIDDCQELEEIPIDFADIATLERIEVKLCKSSVGDSAKNIKEERYQRSGDESLIIL